MRYLDFSVRITEGRDDDTYKVLIDSPVGRGESDFVLPFDAQRAANVLSNVAQVVRGERGRKLRPDSPTPTDPREIGSRLFDALFHGKARTLLDQSLGSIQDDEGVGLRIRLQTDLNVPNSRAIASLPWELMSADPAVPPMTISKEIALVRDLDVIQPKETTQIRGDIRILAIMSNPRGTAPLQLDEERVRIGESWARLKGVKVDFVPPRKLELLDALAEHDYHIIHYMGHGDFDPDTGRGTLLFEDEEGGIHPVDSAELEVVVKDEKSLRLVFLNACKTGTTSAAPSLDPFAGIGTALIRGGVPAVVAMQFPISDDAALRFADTFYRRIREGLPVDGAVGEARKLLWPSLESITPVLFMRSPDGAIFRPAPRRRPMARPVGISAAAVAVVAGGWALWPRATPALERLTWAEPQLEMALGTPSTVRFSASAEGALLDLEESETGLEFAADVRPEGFLRVDSVRPGRVYLTGLREGEAQIVVRAVDAGDGSAIENLSGRPVQSAYAEVIIQTPADLERSARAEVDGALGRLTDPLLPDDSLRATFESISDRRGGIFAGHPWWSDFASTLDGLVELTELGPLAMEVLAADTVLASAQQAAANDYVALNEDVRGGAGPLFDGLSAEVERLEAGLATGRIAVREGPLTTCRDAQPALACTRPLSEFGPGSTIHYSFRSDERHRFRIEFWRDEDLQRTDFATVRGRHWNPVRDAGTSGDWEIRVRNDSDLLVGRVRFTVASR